MAPENMALLKKVIDTSAKLANTTTGYHKYHNDTNTLQTLDHGNYSNIGCPNCFHGSSNDTSRWQNDEILPITVTLVTLMSCISVVGTVGNAVLMIRLVKKFKRNLRARFMAGTICSALMMAVVFQPINIVHLVLPEAFSTTHLLCTLSYAIRGVCVLCHISSVCISSVWNYIYIDYPLNGLKWLSIRRTVASNVVVWVVIIINIFGIYVGFIARKFTFDQGCELVYMEVPTGFLAGTVYGVMVPMLLLSMGVNVKIIVIAQRHLNSIGKNTPSSVSMDTLTNLTTIPVNEGPGGPVPPSRKQSTFRKRWNQNKTHVIFLLATVIFWIPCLVGASMVVISNALSIIAIKKYLIFAIVGVGFGSSSLVTIIEFRKDLLMSNCITGS